MTPVEPDPPEREIVDLLQRRSDLSTFLVHLTRAGHGLSARDKLLTILVESELKAGEPMGMAASAIGLNLSQAARDSQRTVCFTETPLEHVWMLTENIKDRLVKLKPYGMAFTKTWARKRAVNPIWYVDISPGGHDWLVNPINRLLKRVADGRSATLDTAAEEWGVDDLDGHELLRVTPFIEQMGKPALIRKEFWWEREWRHVGDRPFALKDVVTLFAPEADHEALVADLQQRLTEVDRVLERQPPILDPRWGLERMIAALAGVPAESVGPFPN